MEKYGTLDSIIAAGEYADAQKLIITGKISNNDIIYIDQNMPNVEVLDLSGAANRYTTLNGDLLSSSSMIKEISLPYNVKVIEGKPFRNCASLTKVTLPDSLMEIGYASFSGCSGLTSIHIPESVSEIGESAFYHCSSLTEIAIPTNVTNIESEVFMGCSSLVHVTMPDSAQRIGDASFSGCYSLTDITIPKSVTYIGREAFYLCSSLSEIVIPEGVTTISGNVFSGCSSLTHVVIPDGVTSIEYCAFSGCTSLTNVTIPESVTSIGDSAFDGCKSITNITIPEGVTNLGKSPFGNCRLLSSLIIPSSVKETNGFPASDCSSLQKLIWNSTAEIGDLTQFNNPYCWLIINCPDNEVPIYGVNWKNVIINGVADNLVLPSQEDMDISAFKQVKLVKKISYTRNFYSREWETISLPFTPTRITHPEKGLLAPFDSEDTDALNFWLRELTTDGFKDVTRIEANHPYIIAMPNSQEYDEKYNISGNVTFSADNLTSVDFADNTPMSSDGGDYTLYASFNRIEPTDGIYVIDYMSQFVNNSFTLYPFEAYVKPNTSTLRSVISLSNGRSATRAVNSSKRKPQIDDM
jgi:hypothetical protein